MITRLGLSAISRGLYGSFAGKAETIIEVIKTVRAGVPSRIIRPRPKRIMIGNQLFIVESIEEERALLEKYLIRQRKEFTGLITRKKMPSIKAKIKITATQIKRTEKRLMKVDKKSWLAKEDEEILLLLSM